MAKVALTFEAVDRHVARADLRRFRKGGPGHFTPQAVAAAPTDVLSRLCGIWQVVGPIIRLIIKFPLLPKKWRDALATLADLLDNVCKGT